MKFFYCIKVTAGFAIASRRRLMFHSDFVDAVGTGTTMNTVQLTNGFTWVINAYYLLYFRV